MIAHKTPHVKGKSGFFMDFSDKKAGAAARQPPLITQTQPQPHPQPPQPLPLYGEAPHPQPLPQQKMIRSAMMISQTHWLSKMLHRQLFITNLHSVFPMRFSVRIYRPLIPYYASTAKVLQEKYYSFSNLRLSESTNALTASSLSVAMSFEAPQFLQKTLT